MRMLTEQDTETAVSILRGGGVIVIPTETVYGLACRWDDADARERIYRLKRRPATKRLPMLAHDLASAERAGVMESEPLRRLAQAFWPGALTVVAPARQPGETIGLRIPNHPVALAILRTLGEPLACTSANLSGEKSALTVEEALRSLDGEPDAVVDAGRVTVTDGQSSTVVSLLEGQPKILREGPISLRQIEEAMQ